MSAQIWREKQGHDSSHMTLIKKAFIVEQCQKGTPCGSLLDKEKHLGISSSDPMKGLDNYLGWHACCL